MAALVIAMRGRRVLYLGADVPLDETVRAAASAQASAVAISVSAAFDRERAATLLTQVRSALPDATQLWVGGGGAPCGGEGQQHFADLFALDEWIAPLD